MSSPPDDPQRRERERLQSEQDAAAAWSVPAYLLSGMAGYGFLGWLLDRWLGTSWLVLVGVLVGTALAGYLIWLRYGTR
ncbi:AtpZ/AtpI family protein [Kineosporiaceae bacterium SCSIO 59966]|nr:AtpZ/AtpI family protein [Kineosporiaceae bacterium SCSIO 59966]